MTASSGNTCKKDVYRLETRAREISDIEQRLKEEGLVNIIFVLFISISDLTD
jgi:hypothetical protein